MISSKGEGVVQTLMVGLGERSYPIRIGSGILASLGHHLRDALHARRYAVISDNHVAALYGGQVLQALQAAELEGELFTFSAGEASKNLANIEQLASRQVAGLVINTGKFISKVPPKAIAVVEIK